MNDQNPDTPEATPDPSAAPPPADNNSSTDAKRYAAYDTRYQRFVGPVTDKKPSLAQAKKLVGHDDVEIREV